VSDCVELEGGKGTTHSWHAISFGRTDCAAKTEITDWAKFDATRFFAKRDPRDVKTRGIRPGHPLESRQAKR
jgi:hypothetical protein